MSTFGTPFWHVGTRVLRIFLQSDDGSGGRQRRELPRLPLTCSDLKRGDRARATARDRAPPRG